MPIEEVINKVREARPEIVGVSMRLGDLHVDKLISEFVEKATLYGLHPADSGIRYAFSGLRPAANLVRAMTGLPLEEDRFSREDERHYDLDDVRIEFADQPRLPGLLRPGGRRLHHHGGTGELCARAISSRPRQPRRSWSDYLIERIRQVRERENRPIIRAHIGIAAETIEPTVKAIEKLADAAAFEIVSLAPDQTSQELLAKFIRGEEDPSKYLAGQGGAPIRTRRGPAPAEGSHPARQLSADPHLHRHRRAGGTGQALRRAPEHGLSRRADLLLQPDRRPRPDLHPRQLRRALQHHSLVGRSAASRWRSTTRTSGACATPPTTCR